MPIVGVMPASFRFPERDVDLWFPSPVDAPYAQSRLSTWFPDSDRQISVELVPRKRTAVGGIGPSLSLLFGAVSVLRLYGTLSYLVGLRRREVGLRIALGALRSDIVRQFLAQGMRVAAPACLCGLGLALALRRVVAGLLFGVSAADAATLSGVVVLVLGGSSLAWLLPAARAARIEPMRVLGES